MHRLGVVGNALTGDGVQDTGKYSVVAPGAIREAEIGAR